MYDEQHLQETLDRLRVAIQDAEYYGMVYTESGELITGAIYDGKSIVLVQE